MPTYVFRCSEHGHFERLVQLHVDGVPPKSAVCTCGARSDRDMGAEGFALVGAVRTGTGRGSLARQSKMLGLKEVGGREVGRFESTKELDRYMGGANTMGPPVVDHVDAGGNVVYAKDKDGNVMHRGEKLVLYDNNAGPSRADNPPRVDLSREEKLLKAVDGQGFWGDKED